MNELSDLVLTLSYIGWTNCTPSYTAENAIAARDDLNDPVRGRRVSCLLIVLIDTFIAEWSLQLVFLRSPQPRGC